MKVVTMNDRGATPALTVDDVPSAVLQRIAAAHRQAQALLREASIVVREQQELEGILIALGGIEDEDAWNDLRQQTGLVALDSMLGNVAVAISAPGGGLWCGGPPRPWPSTAWPLEDDDQS
jgi:hypothetical protein